MAVIALKCPNCGGGLELEDSRKFGFCTYCGTKIMIQETQKQKMVMDHSEEAANLYDDLKHYYENGNGQKVLELALQIEKIDRNNWNVLACLALFATDIDDVRDFVRLDRAIELCPDPSIKEELQKIRNYALVYIDRDDLILYSDSSSSDGIKIPSGLLLLPPGKYEFSPRTSDRFCIKDVVSGQNEFFWLNRKYKKGKYVFDSTPHCCGINFDVELKTGRYSLPIEIHRPNDEYLLCARAYGPGASILPTAPVRTLDSIVKGFRDKFKVIPIEGLTEEAAYCLTLKSDGGAMIFVEKGSEGYFIRVVLEDKSLKLNYGSLNYSEGEITVTKDTRRIKCTVHEQKGSYQKGLFIKKTVEHTMYSFELTAE